MDSINYFIKIETCNKMQLLELTQAEQLTQIYFDKEWWHDYKMPYEEALNYHQWQLENNFIHTYSEEGIVLGYYQRYFVDNTCYLVNIYIDEQYRHGKVFKELYKHFFNTLPKNITQVVGTSQKLGGKLFTRLITKERTHGN